MTATIERHGSYFLLVTFTEGVAVFSRWFVTEHDARVFARDHYLKIRTT
jgi:hypothetical protein